MTEQRYQQNDRIDGQGIVLVLIAAALASLLAAAALWIGLR